MDIKSTRRTTYIPRGTKERSHTRQRYLEGYYTALIKTCIWSGGRSIEEDDEWNNALAKWGVFINSSADHHVAIVNIVEPYNEW